MGMFRNIKIYSKAIDIPIGIKKAVVRILKGSSSKYNHEMQIILIEQMYDHYNSLLTPQERPLGQSAEERIRHLITDLTMFHVVSNGYEDMTEEEQGKVFEAVEKKLPELLDMKNLLIKAEG